MLIIRIVFWPDIRCLQIMETREIFVKPCCPESANRGSWGLSNPRGLAALGQGQNNLKHTIMYKDLDLIEVAKQFPDMSITIRLEDLVEANRSLITEFLQQEAEEREKYAKEEIYLTREKVMEILGVSPTTLWRWEKTGYLVPFSIGTKRRYRKSEVDKIFQR